MLTKFELSKFVFVFAKLCLQSLRCQSCVCKAVLTKFEMSKFVFAKGCVDGDCVCKKLC